MAGMSSRQLVSNNCRADVYFQARDLVCKVYFRTVAVLTFSWPNVPSSGATLCTCSLVPPGAVASTTPINGPGYLTVPTCIKERFKTSHGIYAALGKTTPLLNVRSHLHYPFYRKRRYTIFATNACYSHGSKSKAKNMYRQANPGRRCLYNEPRPQLREKQVDDGV
jgi:hypothetical protein